jgi:hypothetical protein
MFVKYCSNLVTNQLGIVSKTSTAFPALPANEVFNIVSKFSPLFHLCFPMADYALCLQYSYEQEFKPRPIDWLGHKWIRFIHAPTYLLHQLNNMPYYVLVYNSNYLVAQRYYKKTENCIFIKQ